MHPSKSHLKLKTEVSDKSGFNFIPLTVVMCRLYYFALHFTCTTSTETLNCFHNSERAGGICWQECGGHSSTQ